jgi:hypothetical protein
VSGVEQLLKALSDKQVKFIVVGAYAAIMQGSTLRTDDLDICYERTPANYKRINATDGTLGSMAGSPFPSSGVPIRMATVGK